MAHSQFRQSKLLLQSGHILASVRRTHALHDAGARTRPPADTDLLIVPSSLHPTNKPPPPQRRRSALRQRPSNPRRDNGLLTTYS
eukprot:4471245-Prymnesium_polylepis.1